MTEQGSTVSEWHRLSPLSILFFVLGFFRQTITQIIPAFAVAFAGIASSDAFELSLLFRIAIFGLVLTIGAGILTYLRFRYRITEDHILLRKGVLHREELDVEFERIQNINITEPFYMRPFKMAVLSIDTAGSQAKEMSLAGIDVTQAREIRETIIKVKEALPSGSALPDAAERSATTGTTGTTGTAGTAGTAETTGSAEATDSGGRLLIELSRKDVLLYGLTANFMLWAALALGAFFGSGDVAEEVLKWIGSHFALEETVSLVRSKGGPILLAFLFLGSLLLVMLVLPLISVIGALFRYDGFRLTVDGDTYRKSSGLLTKHDESIKQHKIQALVWNQNAIASWLGRINIQLRQASAGEGIENGQLPTGGKTQFLVPSLKPAQAHEMSGEFLPHCTPAQARFSGINGLRYIRFNLLVVLIPATLIMAIPAVLVSLKLFWLIAVLAGTYYLILKRCWRMFGYAVDGEYGYFRHGFIGSVTTIFPLFKVQRVDMTQTPFQRRAGLAHMTVHLASHSLNIPYVPVADVIALRDYALYAAESSDKAWF